MRGAPASIVIRMSAISIGMRQWMICSERNSNRKCGPLAMSASAPVMAMTGTRITTMSIEQPVTKERVQWPTSKGDPIGPVWSYGGRKGMYQAEALRMFAHDLIDRLNLLEAPPREVMKQASDRDGVDTVALINAQLKTIKGQRRHIATLEAKLRASDKADRDMSEALNSGDGSYRP
jgi:hypothetical protein